MIYHLEKANVVADALSRKSLVDLRAMFARLSISEDRGLLAKLQIRERQPFDESLVRQIHQVESGVQGDFDLNFDGVLRFRGHLCVPGNEDLRHSILPRLIVVISLCIPDLRVLYWWPGLKKGVANFFARCLVCQRVKVEQQCPPEWKWERIMMDFISNLPLIPTHKYSIWVIVDRFTKSTHFLLVRTTFSLHQLAELYI
ncbi:integrase [Gossypium australe]|uniref:Integrase n=1 Tax=Gossypium australe TaxID=47621 RepID=A0A5B6V900_9ROSI|nr:integrase [Gossypium australe]